MPASREREEMRIKLDDIALHYAVPRKELEQLVSLATPAPAAAEGMPHWLSALERDALNHAYGQAVRSDADARCMGVLADTVQRLLRELRRDGVAPGLCHHGVPVDVGDNCAICAAQARRDG